MRSERATVGLSDRLDYRRIEIVLEIAEVGRGGTVIGEVEVAPTLGDTGVLGCVVVVVVIAEITFVEVEHSIAIGVGIVTIPVEKRCPVGASGGGRLAGAVPVATRTRCVDEQLLISGLRDRVVLHANLVVQLDASSVGGHGQRVRERPRHVTKCSYPEASDIAIDRGAVGCCSRGKH